MRQYLKLASTLAILAAFFELGIFVILNNLLPIGPDYLVLLLYLLIPYAVIIVIFKLLILVFRPLFVRLSRGPTRIHINRNSVIPAAVYVLFLNIAGGFVRNYCYKRLPSEYRMGLIITGIVSLLLLIAAYLAYRNFERLRLSFLRFRLGPGRCIILSGLIVFLILFLSSHRSSDTLSQPTLSDFSPGIHSSMDRAERPRVLLLGLDGLDLESVERLSKEDRLPNLQKLMDNGCSGHLETVRPTLSPMLWTSIASGKVERKHGIHDFRFVTFPGVRPLPHTLKRVKFGSLLTNYSFRSRLFKHFYTYRYYTSTMRRCKNLWNILSDSGLRVGVVGWYITWPAEPVNDFISSGRSLLYTKELSSADPGLTYPEDLFSELAQYNVDFSSLPMDSLDWLCDSPNGGDPGLHENCVNTMSEYLKAVQKNYARDLSVLNVSEHMMETDDSWDVMMLYFRSVDSINHLVQKYINDNGRDMDDPLYIMSDNYCEFIDKYVGRITEQLDENTITIIVSDHGWDRETGHPFAPPGIIILNGKYIRKGPRVEGMTIYDIAPTVLYLMGLPVAEDMDGRPAFFCLEEGFVEVHPVDSIPTYEEGEVAGTSLPCNPRIEQEMNEQLKTLGYIE